MDNYGDNIRWGMRLMKSMGVDMDGRLEREEGRYGKIFKQSAAF